MKNKSDVLGSEELEEISRRRADARARARAMADQISDDEDAILTAAAEADGDNPPLTDEQWARMRPAHDVVPHLVAAQLRKKGGRPKSPAPKQLVTLRLKPEVLEAYRSTGAGWQTRMAEALEAGIFGRQQ